jgi:hypothetical protein
MLVLYGLHGNWAPKMHDIKKIREDPVKFVISLQRRGIFINIEEILELDRILRDKKTELQLEQQKLNEHNKKIGLLVQYGKMRENPETTSWNKARSVLVKLGMPAEFIDFQIKNNYEFPLFDYPDDSYELFFSGEDFSYLKKDTKS